MKQEKEWKRMCEKDEEMCEWQKERKKAVVEVNN